MYVAGSHIVALIARPKVAGKRYGEVEAILIALLLAWNHASDAEIRYDKTRKMNSRTVVRRSMGGVGSEGLPPVLRFNMYLKAAARAERPAPVQIDNSRPNLRLNE